MSITSTEQFLNASGLSTTVHFVSNNGTTGVQDIICEQYKYTYKKLNKDGTR